MSDMKKLMFTEVKLIYSIAILKSEPKSEFKLCNTQILSRVFAREILRNTYCSFLKGKIVETFEGSYCYVTGLPSPSVISQEERLEMWALNLGHL